ncbi:S8 family peptidase [Nakamurella alba]|nr:S8 family peptidase [Nakamurella alba]
MSRTRARRVSRWAISSLTVVALVGAAPGTAGAAPLVASPGATVAPVAQTEFAPGRYIVTLKKSPVASYTGGTEGIPATKPVDGAKIDLSSTAARRYLTMLARDQAAVAQSAGVAPTDHYSIALNGFTAGLTGEQAQELAANPEVLSVTKDAFVKASDDRVDYDFLKLSGNNGLWKGLGGTKGAGKGIVIGVIDTGVWPESKSFAGEKLGTKADPKNPTKAYKQGSSIVMKKANGQTFTGACETGEEFTADMCNTKLISARWFGDSFLAAYPGDLTNDYESPRDGDGHGTHTGSTAGGNYGVQASVDGYGYGAISGVAPAASIAVYKALWTAADPDNSGGFNSDILAAVDAAVSDGVDVINFSVGSTTESSIDDPIELAFLSAAAAGIFVSASAGNSGPGSSTLDHPSPWLTTVAASTLQPREGSVKLGNGAVYAGASTTVLSQVGPLPLVAASAVALPGAVAADATRCYEGTLDPAKVAGKIVECDRGGNDRVAKSAEVKRAGGTAMILANVTVGGVNGDVHSVPTVHIESPNGNAVKAYAQTAGATATLVPGNITSTPTPYPQIAGFSSRGPSTSTDGNILKPDIAAPGVDILAAIAPASNNGRDFDFLSGTSMAAPHIAGLAALYKQKYPKWSPMAIKSAMMTTAYDLKNADGSKNTDPFAQGAGHVDPSKMFSPGMIFNAGVGDWLSFLEGSGFDTGSGAPAKDPSDYNQASIAVGQLVSSQTVTRSVTSTQPGIYKPQITGVKGFKVAVSPSILFFDRAGQTKSFKVTLTRTDAALGEYSTGFLSWKGAVYTGSKRGFGSIKPMTVRLPIAVKPVALKNTAPVVSIEGTSGSVTWDTFAGFSGPFTTKGFGLAAGVGEDGNVTADGENEYPLTVAEGTKLVRFSAYGPDDSSGADIDLTVYQIIDGVGYAVGQSASASAQEHVDLVAPEAGDYVAVVAGFSNAAGTTSTDYLWRTYTVAPEGGVGSFTTSPASTTVKAGQKVPVTASASGLDANTSYLGWVEFVDGSGSIFEANRSK